MGDLVKNLPEYIANPQAIVRMNSGRLNLFTQIKTPKGENGILSIELNSTKDINNKFDKYNLVITIYSANDNHTKNNIVDNGVKVEYEKEDLMQVNPQLCKWLAIVNKRSSNDSIKNPTKNVKENVSKTNTEYLTAVENGDMETAQRLVDETAVNAGYTQKAYHGTGADFNIFSEENIGKRNVWGKGFYFGFKPLHFQKTAMPLNHCEKQQSRGI